ncbi:MAG: Na(+)/H(+) antiporter subunit D [Acidobacteriota bacterium]
MEALSNLPPGAPMMLGGLLLLLPWLRGRALTVASFGLAVASYLHFLALPSDLTITASIFGLDLVPVRLDALSRVWGHIFHIAAVLSCLYALHVEDRQQQAAGLIYAGAAIGAVFAGDLATLFVWWEVTAVASLVLIVAPEPGNADRDPRTAFRVGMRYLLIQVLSGVLLLAGLLLRLADGAAAGDDPPLAFGQLFSGDLLQADLSTWLIFLAFGIKAAFPLLHNWLQDAYPKATHTGSVFLSAFTTKMAIYALARGFAGTEALVWIGVVMTAFPIFYAVLENDLRRVLSYSLNNQLGFMCVGIGIGSELALAGAAAHAFAHILYKSLLFQSVGAVLYRVGTAKATELGGLYKSMPWTTGFCIVGSMSISAFPLTSGFVTKSMILSAAAYEHRTVVFLALLFASAGVLDHSGIKIPYFAFFAHDSGLRPREAPWHMLVAMGVTAALCLLIGCLPGTFYGWILPFDVHYEPYTTLHSLTQYQLLFFAILAFVALNKLGIYPHERRSTNIDFDWTYRRLAPAALGPLTRSVSRAWHGAIAAGMRRVRTVIDGAHDLFVPAGVIGRTWTVGQIVLWIMTLTAGYLILEFLRR